MAKLKDAPDSGHEYDAQTGDTTKTPSPQKVRQNAKTKGVHAKGKAKGPIKGATGH